MPPLEYTAHRCLMACECRPGHRGMPISVGRRHLRRRRRRRRGRCISSAIISGHHHHHNARGAACAAAPGPYDLLQAFRTIRERYRLGGLTTRLVHFSTCVRAPDCHCSNMPTSIVFFSSFFFVPPDMIASHVVSQFPIGPVAVGGASPRLRVSVLICMRLDRTDIASDARPLGRGTPIYMACIGWLALA